MGTSCTSRGTDITVIGPGEVGPNIPCPGLSYAVWLEGYSNVLLEGLDIHGTRTCTGSDHYETIRYQGGPTNISIIGNRFYDNVDTTSTFFFSGGFPHETCSGAITSSSARSAYSIYFEDQGNIATCSNMTIEYNSFDDMTGSAGVGDIWLNNACAASNVIFRGNVMPMKAGGCFGTWTFNVYQAATNPNCGATNVWVSGPAGRVGNLGYVTPNVPNPNLHITDSSPAKNAGDPANFPASDIDHDSRPLGSGNNENVDSGADER